MDGPALCPYCGEPLPGHRDPAAAFLFLAAPAALCAGLTALLARPLPLAAVADALGFGYGSPLSSALSGLAALLLFLPSGRPAPGAPLPVRARDVVFGILWRIALLLDGALFAAPLAEGAPNMTGLLLPGVLLAACAWGVWRFRLGWRALAALLLVAAASFAANG
jgi:hypothetical protein